MGLYLYLFHKPDDFLWYEFKIIVISLHAPAFDTCPRMPLISLTFDFYSSDDNLYVLKKKVAKIACFENLIQDFQKIFNPFIDFPHLINFPLFKPFLPQ